MNIDILNAPGKLFLGSTAASARAAGARQFNSAARAIRFAMEQAAPVSLRGAQLCVGGRRYSGRQIAHLHQKMHDIGQARRPGR
ncbi:hypothetical protein [Devosia sp. XK-2]|uniref:hypothetical protein n=1 Tax=Devosia sp. XK-2 TaxID=3126689 RepID=UPI0030D159DC